MKTSCLLPSLSFELRMGNDVVASLDPKIFMEAQSLSDCLAQPRASGEGPWEVTRGRAHGRGRSGTRLGLLAACTKHAAHSVWRRGRELCHRPRPPNRPREDGCGHHPGPCPSPSLSERELCPPACPVMFCSLFIPLQF